MSSQGGSNAAAQIIETYSSVIKNNYFSFALAGPLVLHEHSITFDQELRLFWRRKSTGASVLFFVTRYWLLLNYSIFTLFAFAVSQYIAWAAFSALRVLALSGMNWPLAGIVFLLSVGPSAVNFAQFALGIRGENVLTLGCQGITAPPPTHADSIMSVLSSCLSNRTDLLTSPQTTTLILADIMVIGVTVAKTWRGSSLRIDKGGVSSLGDVLLYNGIKYFAVLLCLNISQVILTHLSIDVVSQQGSYIVIISDPLTAIFICRFLLDLQSANQTSLQLGTQRTERDADADPDGTLVFASHRVIGTIGGSTRPDWGSGGACEAAGSAEGSSGTWVTRC
ncbi:hypothetical protein BD413DRAFT_617711 [Trametes elegans]|nr:hypothetical protein BD413DRAFT_617711 [Trametes elegans]